MKERGIVKWFHEQKGYGFIENTETHKKFFVHYKNILGEDFKTLGQGQAVLFVPKETPRGAIAAEVELSK